MYAWFCCVSFGFIWPYFMGTSWNGDALLALTHYNDVIMSAMASRITSLTIVYSTVYSGADQRKHQSSASLAFVQGIHRWPVNSPHKGPVARKMFPFDDVIMADEVPLNNSCIIMIMNIHNSSMHCDVTIPIQTARHHNAAACNHNRNSLATARVSLNGMFHCDLWSRWRKLRIWKKCITNRR